MNESTKDEIQMTIDTYDAVATEYDNLYSEIYYMDELNKFVNLIRPKGKVLYAGCGIGLLWLNEGSNVNNVKAVKYNTLHYSYIK